MKDHMNEQDKLERLRAKGLIPKYIITKADGSPVDPGAEYFVLRLDHGGGDSVHIQACRTAILEYACQIEKHLPLLAQEIRSRYGEHQNPQGPQG